MKAVETAKGSGQANVEQTCQRFTLHGDAYYKLTKRMAKRKAAAGEVVVLVKEERIEQPRVDPRELHEAFRFTFEASGLRVGRDKLFGILGEYDLLTRRKRA